MWCWTWNKNIFTPILIKFLSNTWLKRNNSQRRLLKAIYIVLFETIKDQRRLLHFGCNYFWNNEYATLALEPTIERSKCWKKLGKFNRCIPQLYFAIKQQGCATVAACACAFQFVSKAIAMPERDNINLLRNSTAISYVIMLAREPRIPSEKIHGQWLLTSTKYPEHSSQEGDSASRPNSRNCTEGPKLTTRGGWMRADQNFPRNRSVGLYPENHHKPSNPRWGVE